MKDELTEQEKAYIDLALYGTSVTYTTTDGEVKHIPYNEIKKEWLKDIDNDR